jgi:hypothetical protein
VNLGRASPCAFGAFKDSVCDTQFCGVCGRDVERRKEDKAWLTVPPDFRV